MGRYLIDVYSPLGGEDYHENMLAIRYPSSPLTPPSNNFGQTLSDKRNPLDLFFFGPPFGFALPRFLAVTCWVGIFGFLQSVTCETLYPSHTTHQAHIHGRQSLIVLKPHISWDVFLQVPDSHTLDYRYMVPFSTLIMS